ncbi:MAG TPA: patatin-like phospholipase family protein [Candidatus Polarisedimenticolia bacterium]|nr:patatin-like phospholipase family protein [Candidatus Polarisedimenticolia bacterium]
MSGVEGGGSRFALVLGAGGVRGIAHLGVLRRLVACGLRPDALVGCSAGALIAAFYAGAGIDAEELVDYGTAVTARHLLAYGLVLRRFRKVPSRIRERCDWFSDRLALLDRCDVDRLAFGVRRLGLLTFDTVSRRELFIATGANHHAVTLGDAARGSAAVPLLFPSRRIQRNGVRLRLIDGGVSRTLPVSNAFDPPFGARHVLAVKVSRMPGVLERPGGYFQSLQKRYGDRLILLDIDVPPLRSLFYSEDQNRSLVEAGERAVTPQLVARIRAWTEASG